MTMVAAISLLVVVTVSILITRIAAVMLTETGLSREAARFQARSAFTGAGFTTAESERVVSHPVRRRIVLVLMLLGNAGIVSAVSSLILTFVGDDDQSSLTLRIVLLTLGLAILWGLATSPWVDRQLARLIDWALHRYTRLDVKDYASLLQLSGDYRVVELEVQPDDWLSDKRLEELQLREEGIVVLGIQRDDDTYLGVPQGDTTVAVGDVLISYGRSDALEALDERRRGRSGEREHSKAKQEQEKIVEEQASEDEESREAQQEAQQDHDKGG